MKIEENDRLKILEYMNSYKLIHKDISELENYLNILEKKKKDLVKRLLKLRDSESNYNEYIQEKYGSNITIDFITGKILK